MADKGDNVEAQYYVARIYANGMDNVPVDYAKAAEWYQRAAKKKFQPAMQELGREKETQGFIRGLLLSGADTAHGRGGSARAIGFGLAARRAVDTTDATPAEKNKRMKQRRAMLKASRTPMKGEERKEEICST